MNPLKKTICCLFCVLSFVYSTEAQEKEWEKLIDLLQKEAAHFQGKSGLIQLLKSEYNVFTLEKLSVTDSQIVNAYRMHDRFGNEASELYMEESLMLDPELPIARAEIWYDYNFYFEDFPETQFLLIEFDMEYSLINQISTIYKDLKSGEETKRELEDKTKKIVLPIRSKNRSKIFKAIDDYQCVTLKEELKLDREH